MRNVPPDESGSAARSYSAFRLIRESQYAATYTLFFLLLSVDLLFMLFHALHLWSPWLRSPDYSIEADRGMAETYQYVKLFWLTLGALLIYVQNRKKAFLCWAVVFGFLLLDDATDVHERIGFWLSQKLALPVFWVLQPADLGELLFSGFVGFTVLNGVGLALWKGDKAARTVSGDFLLLVILLAFFGVGVDFLNALTNYSAPQYSGVLTLIEGGGEMIVVSCLTAYAFDILSSGGRLRIDLLANFRSL